MQNLVSITQKGQVTIPKKLRDKFGIKLSSKLYVEEGQDFIKVMPTFDILDMAGSLKPKTKKSTLKAREQFEKTFKRF